MDGKKFYLSKTFWVNLIALVAIVAFGIEAVSPETQVAILAVINMILRLVTKEPVVWSSN